MSSLDNKTISRFMKLASLDDSQVANYISSEIKSSLITEGSASDSDTDTDTDTDDDDKVQGTENGRKLLQGEEEPEKDKIEVDLDEQIREQVEKIISEVVYGGAAPAAAAFGNTGLYTGAGLPAVAGNLPAAVAPIATGGSAADAAAVAASNLRNMPLAQRTLSQAANLASRAAPYARAALTNPYIAVPAAGVLGGMAMHKWAPEYTAAGWEDTLDLVPGESAEGRAQSDPLEPKFYGAERMAGRRLDPSVLKGGFNWAALDDATFMAQAQHGAESQPGWQRDLARRQAARAEAASKRAKSAAAGRIVTGQGTAEDKNLLGIFDSPTEDLAAQEAAGVADLPDAGAPAAMAAEEAISSPASIAAEEVPAPEDWTRSSGRQRKARILSHPDAVMSDPTTWRPSDREGFRSWYRSAKARRQDRELAKQQAATLAAATTAPAEAPPADIPFESETGTHEQTYQQTSAAKVRNDMLIHQRMIDAGMDSSGEHAYRLANIKRNLGMTPGLQESNMIRNMVRDSILAEISVNIGEKLPPSIEEDNIQGLKKEKGDEDLYEDSGTLPRWGSEKSGPFSQAVHEEQGIFAPNHYCAHHVRENASGREGHVVEHNWNETLQEVTKYDVQFEDELVESIPASDLTILEASLAKEHAGHMAKRDDDEPLEEETVEETETLNEWKNRRLGEALFKKFIK
jgi:hypothetical protein